MKKTVRVLMWAHYIYLLSLPTLAVVSARMMFPADEFWKILLMAGFPSVLMFTLFLANGYALPDSLPIALIVTLAIPLQIAFSVFLFGSRSIWLFFAENATVEIGSFVFGTLSVALLARRKEYPLKFFIFLALLTLAMFCGGVASYILLVYYGYGGWSPWLILFGTAFASACWQYAKVYKRVVEAHRKTGAMQNVEMKFDGGFLTRILGIKSDVPMISPFRHRAQKHEPTKLILIFGFTAMFLPLIVGVILELALH